MLMIKKLLIGLSFLICSSQIVVGGDDTPREKISAPKSDNTFIRSCQNPDDLRDVVTLFLHKAPPHHDEHGVKSSEFLGLLAKKISNKIEINRNRALKLKDCVESNFFNIDCGSTKKWIEVELRNYIKETRFHLALAQSTYHTTTMLQMAEDSLNYDQSSLGSYKEVYWKKLDKEEREFVDKKWLSTMTLFKSKTKDMDESDLKHLILADRIKHFLQYQEHMAQLPLMQYFESYDYTPESFLNSINLFLDAINEESEKLNQIENDLTIAHHNLTDSDLYLLKYSGIVEDVLAEKPQYCSVASSLIIYRGRKQNFVFAMTSIPLVIVSIIAPPLVGTSVGVISSVYYAYDSQITLMESKSRNLTKIYDSNTDELKELTTYFKERNLKAILIPFSIGGYTLSGEKLLKVANRAVILRKIIYTIQKFLI